jgi:hypothetical protein
MRSPPVLPLVLCLLAASACTRWQPVAAPAPGPVRHARVTSNENAVLVLRDVEVTADSVIGWHDVATAPLQPPHRQRIAMHRGQVRSIEQGTQDPARSGLLALLGTCAAALVYQLARLSV